MPADEWLIVVDMQLAFREPGAWNVPGFADAAGRIADLLPRYGGRVILTRYVPPAPLAGAWRRYFAAFPTMLLPADDPAWDIAIPCPAGGRVETRPTFGKWDAGMAALTGPDAPLAVCGVATECCVLATVLAAADAGRQVRVLEDACAGATADLHAQALAVMRAFAPVVTVARTSDTPPAHPPRTG